MGKLNSKTIGYIENELYHYHENIKALSETKEEIRDSSPAPPDGLPKGNGTSNPTESKAIQIMSSRVILYTERRLRAIQKVLCRYQDNPEMMKLINMIYFKRTHTAYGVMGELHISPKTFYRWRHELLEDIASEIGI